MKIVIFSSTFLPNIGGLENIMAGLAEEWTNLGHDVVVYTNTPQGSYRSPHLFSIIFKPSFTALNKAVSTADIYLEANISLKNILVGLLHQKKWWVVHHIQYDHDGSKTGFLKQFFSRFSNNICVSNFIASKLKAPSRVIPNFFAPSFTQDNMQHRPYDLVYLGRLVSDKGVDKLIEAIGGYNKQYKCLIIGSGPEQKTLKRLVQDKQLSEQINFSTPLQGLELTKTLNLAKVMVIPSLWDEPFGIVALEGMACGCTIVCSNKPGLIEATGGLAFYFEPTEHLSMITAINNAVNFNKDEHFNNKVKQHLHNHSRSVIAKKYISLFENPSF